MERAAWWPVEISLADVIMGGDLEVAPHSLLLLRLVPLDRAEF